MNHDRKEAAESEKLRKQAEDLERQRLEEAAKALEEQNGNSKFKPTIMTYNDVTKTAEPYDKGGKDETGKADNPTAGDDVEAGDGDKTETGDRKSGDDE